MLHMIYLWKHYLNNKENGACSDYTRIKIGKHAISYMIAVQTAHQKYPLNSKGQA